MKKHTRVYLDAMGYDDTDFIPCEVCGQRAVDIHHIEARGMGGSKTKDTIDNLMAVCRACHMRYGDKKDYKQLLITKHNEAVRQRKGQDHQDPEEEQDSQRQRPGAGG